MCASRRIGRRARTLLFTVNDRFRSPWSDAPRRSDAPCHPLRQRIAAATLGSTVEIHPEERPEHLDVGVEGLRAAFPREIDVQIPKPEQGRGRGREAPFDAPEQVIRADEVKLLLGGHGADHVGSGRPDRVAVRQPVSQLIGALQKDVAQGRALSGSRSVRRHPPAGSWPLVPRMREDQPVQDLGRLEVLALRDQLLALGPPRGLGTSGDWERPGVPRAWVPRIRADYIQDISWGTSTPVGNGW